MTVHVNGTDAESYWRQVWVGMQSPLNYAGGNSSAISAPSSNPRIDLLTISTAGALAWTTGTENASPSPPACPTNKIPICYVYCKTTMTKIVNYEDKDTYPNDGYLYRDVRPLITFRLDPVPPGMISPYGGNTAPAGYLMCDGSNQSRTTYADLFSIIGTTFGNGDGNNTFNLPNLKQRFPLGKADSGTGSTLGATGGAIDHNHSMSHTHVVARDGWGSQAGTTSGRVATADVGVYLEATGNKTSEGSSISYSGNNNPPYQVVNYIIKY